MLKSYAVGVRCNSCGEHGRAWRNLSPEEARLIDALGAEITSVTDWNLAMVTFQSDPWDAPEPGGGQ